MAQQGSNVKFITEGETNGKVDKEYLRTGCTRNVECRTDYRDGYKKVGEWM